ncbi:8-oxo-dGTP diphosphatase [Kitasatospora sp. GAS204A]|nr:8-oxo-dGTP diphosphatase [Kitasatospora sp. GAS204B]
MGERLRAERQPDPRRADPRTSASAEPGGSLARRQLREAKKHGPRTGSGHTVAPDSAAADGSVSGPGPGGGSAGRVGTVLAAGAVLWRPGGPRRDGSGERKPRIALIHRPKYDDWSLPKGKLRAGETPWQAALREVEEETGLVCRLLAPLPAQYYLAQGRPKEVRYWAAVPVRGEFRPNREVDRMKWLKPAKARAKLTHARDRELIDALLAQLGWPAG